MMAREKWSLSTAALNSGGTPETCVTHDDDIPVPASEQLYELKLGAVKTLLSKEAAVAIAAPLAGAPR